ncbi:hypothetical protein JQ596_21810 [Bradyrhizobium manausense]|uniref:hypothetical protein n=1 Tax=Bradyrhizobium TaxID=374 RepID=UPI001BA82B96|nr:MULTISPECIES: hypothetical protein [Bradyrhizobium]MBR0828177.1 hypothetical protein [Bradyrhizobium manausense]UVO25220.1 hypothetical protein KUF59_21615 [Bradyrhizobium arachidis]
MTNDTAVFDALCFDPQLGEKVSTGRMGTRQAIARDGLDIDADTLAYCPHEWIDASGYVDLELARKYRHPIVL